MKYLFLLLISASLFSCSSLQKNSFDPTGTYRYGERPMDKPDTGVEYNGQIQVFKLSEDQLIMTFEINKGAPSYNSGSFVDTLVYSENKVIYTNLEYFPGCKVTFEFDKKGVDVKQNLDKPNDSCGFGNGVVAQGYFGKSSEDTPVLRFPVSGEPLQ